MRILLNSNRPLVVSQASAKEDFSPSPQPLARHKVNQQVTLSLHLRLLPLVPRQHLEHRHSLEHKVEARAHFLRLAHSLAVAVVLVSNNQSSVRQLPVVQLVPLLYSAKRVL